MSFQDLLNRPLPSKDVYTEAQLDDNISEDIAELSRTYKKSVKTIKEKINIIRIGIRTNKLNAALNSIKQCKKIVNTDRSDIEKQIKYIESKGLTKNYIKATIATIGIGAAAKLAFDTKRHLDLKKELKNAEKEDIESSKELNRVITTQRVLDEDLEKYKRDAAKYGEDSDEMKKRYQKLQERRIQLHTDGLPAEANKQLAMKNVEDAKHNIKMNKLTSAASSGVLGAVAAISYSDIRSFTTVKDKYEEYYDNTVKTLDMLEDRCKTKSKNIKESCDIFMIETEDMEILLENVCN